MDEDGAAAATGSVGLMKSTIADDRCRFQVLLYVLRG